MSTRYIQRLVKLEPCDYRSVLRLARRKGLGRAGFSAALRMIIREWAAQKPKLKEPTKDGDSEAIAESGDAQRTSVPRSIIKEWESQQLVHEERPDKVNHKAIVESGQGRDSSQTCDPDAGPTISPAYPPSGAASCSSVTPIPSRLPALPARLQPGPGEPGFIHPPFP